MKNPKKWNGKTYDYVDVAKKGGAKLRGVVYSPGVYLGRMLVNDGKRGWMPAETDAAYKITTPQTFCRLVGLPWTGAKMYTGNKKASGYCDMHLFGPPFDDFTRKGLKYYFDLNCRTSDVKKVKKATQCSALAKPHSLSGYNGCDTWIWCKK